MKKNLIVLGFAVLALAGCKQFKKGPGDLQYIIHEDESGTNIKEGDFLAIKFIQKTEEDSILASSFDFDRPTFLIQQKAGFKGDIYDGLAMLSQGDSATFKVNIDSMAAKGMPKPTGTKGKYILFTIKVDKIIPKGKLADTLFQKEIDKFLKAEIANAKNQEAGKISSYVASKDLKPTVTASGLNYIITKEGTGPKPSPGDTVKLDYTGMFLSGKAFASSVKANAEKGKIYNPQIPYEPMKVSVGMGGTIPGFDEALLLLPKGTKATIIVPSKLAYGEQGNREIPPYMPLVFELEVLDIVKPKPGAAPQQPMQMPGMPQQ
ncbi:MAG: FKBP-type peptidyl-prolyl cis-trans isomerase [Sphingobacteriaceae bacterium]|nr:FKBP-type peptidyl-prolyl cis-trans isomerase [Sphingobacteriaceae bacterium]